MSALALRVVYDCYGNHYTHTITTSPDTHILELCADEMRTKIKDVVIGQSNIESHFKELSGE